jgi:DNA repair protein RadC
MTSTLLGRQFLFEFFRYVAQRPDRSRISRDKTATAFGLLTQASLVAPFSFPGKPYEYKVMALRECPTPESLQLCDTPDRAADYWRMHVPLNPYFNPECECFSVLLLNTRRRVKGHYLVSTGTLDTLLVHPREVFRLAVITAAAAIVLAHNHPSGDPSPSEADIKVTRDLIRAGQLLKIEVLDHVILGNPKHCSLRELGYFYS